LTIALEQHLDQAAGLRLLLRSAAPRVIAFCSAPGAGRSALCASFASALARVGRRVLVLDCADAGAATLLGAARQPDLLAAARAGLATREFVVQADPGLAVVRAGGAFRALAQLSVRDRERLVQALEAVRSDRDCVLVDAARGDLVLAAGCSDLVLVVRPHAEGVLESYRLLKRMAPTLAVRSVLVLVNRAQPGVQSMRIFGNLSATARQFLGMSLEFGGEIPEDQSLQRASSLKQPVVEVFPGSPAARAVRSCAFGLLGRDNAEALGAEAFVGRLSAAARAIAPHRAQAG
jgi:flagellar biosynthesis protein FlhG